MSEKASPSVSAALQRSLVNAGQAEINSDAAAAKKLGMTPEQYRQHLLDLFNKAATQKSQADKMYNSGSN